MRKAHTKSEHEIELTALFDASIGLYGFTRRGLHD